MKSPLTIVISYYIHHKPLNSATYVHQLNAIVWGMPCRPEVVPELKEMAEDASKGASSLSLSRDPW